MHSSVIRDDSIKQISQEILRLSRTPICHSWNCRLHFWKTTVKESFFNHYYWISIDELFQGLLFARGSSLIWRCNYWKRNMTGWMDLFDYNWNYLIVFSMWRYFPFILRGFQKFESLNFWRVQCQTKRNFSDGVRMTMQSLDTENDLWVYELERSSWRIYLICITCHRNETRFLQNLILTKTRQNIYQESRDSCKSSSLNDVVAFLSVDILFSVKFYPYDLWRIADMILLMQCKTRAFGGRISRFSKVSRHKSQFHFLRNDQYK